MVKPCVEPFIIHLLKGQDMQTWPFVTLDYNRSRNVIMRKIKKHGAFIISVLVAYLVKDLVLYLMGDFKKMHDDRYFAVGIGMLLVIVIFYPLYELFKEISKSFIESYLRRSKRAVKSRFIGILLGFCLALAFLYGVYAYLWYDINILKDLQAALKL